MSSSGMTLSSACSIDPVYFDQTKHPNYPAPQTGTLSEHKNEVVGEVSTDP